MDVPPDAFVDAIWTFNPQVVALSGLLTLAYDAMRWTIETIKAAGLQDNVRIMIGGGHVDDTIREYTGAHAYGEDALAALRLARGWMENGA